MYPFTFDLKRADGSASYAFRPEMIPSAFHFILSLQLKLYYYSSDTQQFLSIYTRRDIN